MAFFVIFSIGLSDALIYIVCYSNFCIRYNVTFLMEWFYFKHLTGCYDELLKQYYIKVHALKNIIYFELKFFLAQLKLNRINGIYLIALSSFLELRLLILAIVSVYHYI